MTRSPLPSSRSPSTPKPPITRPSLVSTPGISSGNQTGCDIVSNAGRFSWSHSFKDKFTTEGAAQLTITVSSDKDCTTSITLSTHDFAIVPPLLQQQRQYTSTHLNLKTHRSKKAALSTRRRAEPSTPSLHPAHHSAQSARRRCLGIRPLRHLHHRHHVKLRRRELSRELRVNDPDETIKIINQLSRKHNYAVSNFELNHRHSNLIYTTDSSKQPGSCDGRGQRQAWVRSPDHPALHAVQDRFSPCA